LILCNNGECLFSKTGMSLPPHLGIVFAFLLICLWFTTLYAIEKYFVSLPRKQKINSILKLIVIQYGIWLSFGLSFAFILPSINLDTAARSGSIYVLGWAIGYIVIFAPGGLGIRELALAWLLGGMLQAGDAMIVATVHRVLFTAIEVVMGIVSGFMSVSISRSVETNNKTVLRNDRDD
jgi:uncharacterized membrane protein YbhN (UPF0104 family)